MMFRLEPRERLPGPFGAEIAMNRAQCSQEINSIAERDSNRRCRREPPSIDPGRESHSYAEMDGLERQRKRENVGDPRGARIHKKTGDMRGHSVGIPTAGAIKEN